MLCNQHEQPLSFQNLIFDSNLLTFCESLMLSGTRFHNLGLKCDIVSEPSYTDLIFLGVK